MMANMTIMVLCPCRGEGERGLAVRPGSLVWKLTSAPARCGKCLSLEPVFRGNYYICGRVYFEGCGASVYCLYQLRGSLYCLLS
jgi:hypothetical protein